MSEAQYAAALAVWIEGEQHGTAIDGLHLGPTDLTLVAKALRALSALTNAISPPKALKATCKVTP